MGRKDAAKASLRSGGPSLGTAFPAASEFLSGPRSGVRLLIGTGLIGCLALALLYDVWLSLTSHAAWMPCSEAPAAQPSVPSTAGSGELPEVAEERRRRRARLQRMLTGAARNREATYEAAELAKSTALFEETRKNRLVQADKAVQKVMSTLPSLQAFPVATAVVELPPAAGQGIGEGGGGAEKGSAKN
mmetsp:Transcript_32793/g.83256  ORF Transcript_32793/g.83256 Transcript_32793/m.83256 type:complete len:189 (-) Transcript_32793:20-586(-)